MVIQVVHLCEQCECTLSSCSILLCTLHAFKNEIVGEKHAYGGLIAELSENESKVGPKCWANYRILVYFLWKKK